MIIWNMNSGYTIDGENNIKNSVRNFENIFKKFVFHIDLHFWKKKQISSFFLKKKKRKQNKKIIHVVLSFYRHISSASPDFFSKVGGVYFRYFYYVNLSFFSRRARGFPDPHPYISAHVRRINKYRTLFDCVIFFYVTRFFFLFITLWGNTKQIESHVAPHSLNCCVIQFNSITRLSQDYYRHTHVAVTKCPQN